MLRNIWLLYGFIFSIIVQANPSFEAEYTFDYFNNLDGGVKTGGAYVDNLSVSMEVEDLGLESSTFFISGIYNNSNTFSDEYVGDAQVVSNIDNSHTQRLYELWYKLDTKGFNVAAGVMDLNGIYDVIDTAGLFINSSHGIGPDFAQSGVNGPSIFPNTTLAVHLEKPLSEELFLQTAVFDATAGDVPDHPNRLSLNWSDGALSVTEIKLAKKDMNLAVGGWFYTENTESFTGEKKKNKGVYFSIEKAFQEFEKPISTWFRVGLADSEVNQFSEYLGAGITVSDLIFEEARDTLGLAIAHARTSSTYRRETSGGSTSAETVLELTYQIQVHDQVQVQPDIQYVINPSASNDLDDAVVAGLRVIFTLL